MVHIVYTINWACQLYLHNHHVCYHMFYVPSYSTPPLCATCRNKSHYSESFITEFNKKNFQHEHVQTKSRVTNSQFLHGFQSSLHLKKIYSLLP